MSTDLQKYPLKTSRDHSALCRAARFEIIKVFEDSGRSGLRIDGRDGLQLLCAKCNQAVRFQAILVYERQRWGRFRMLTRALIMSIMLPGWHSRALLREQFDNDGP